MASLALADTGNPITTSIDPLNRDDVPRSVPPPADKAAPQSDVVPFPVSLWPALLMLLAIGILRRCGWRVA